MKLDDRDEQLGAMLDRSFEGAASPTAPEPGSVMRRGTRRRATVLVASLATVAVFVGSVGFAAAQFGKDARPPAAPEGWAMLVAPDLPWTMPIPPGWASGGYRFAGGVRSILKDVRASYVSNHAVAFDGWASLGPLPTGVADDTVIVLTDQFVGQGRPTPSGRLAFNAEHEDRENQGWSWRDAKVCQQEDCVRIYVWHGPAVSAGSLTLAERVAEGVTREQSLPAANAISPKILFDDRADGFTMSYPAGWTVAEGSLTPELADPREIVSIGTFELRAGGAAPFDAHLPSYALNAVGPDDVFITLQETGEGDWGEPRSRPVSFDPAVWCEHPDCDDGTRQGLDPLRAWWIAFQDAGRGFYAFVAMGEEAFADPARSDAAWRVLDSLEFDRTSNPLTFPAPTLMDYYDRFAGDGEGSRVWPLSVAAQAGVRYRFEVGHCGLNHVTDFDGSFWEPILAHPLGADEPSALINTDRGTIRVISPRQAIYTSSSGEKVGLRRIEGPIVLGGCL
jgi:hypothetical protein